MPRVENEQSPEAVLAECLADDTQVMVKSDMYGNDTHYEFEQMVKETDGEQSVCITRIIIRDKGDDYVNSHIHKRQKFICVNGPLAGQRVPAKLAPDYIVFNRSSVGRENKDVPKAVLVHRSWFALA